MNGENQEQSFEPNSTVLSFIDEIQPGEGVNEGALARFREEIERLCQENETLSLEYNKLRRIHKQHASALSETKKSLKSQIVRRKESEENFSCEKKSLEQKLYLQNQELRAANERLMREIAERNTAENALRSSEIRYRRLFNEVPVGLFQILQDGKIIEINNTAIGFFGFEDKAELYEINFYSLFKEPDKLQSGFSNLYSGDIHGLETELVTRTGQIAWLRVDAQAAAQNRAREIIIEGSLIDITGQKNAQLKLEKSESALNRSQEIARIGNWETDLETGKITWSDEMSRIFGYTPGSLKDVGFDTFLSHVHPDDREEFLSIRGEAISRGNFTKEFRIISQGGEIKHISAHAEFVYDSTGRPIKLFGTNQDISTLKSNEERLRIILEATSDGTWEWDMRDDTVSFDKKLAEGLLTIPSGKMGSRSFLDLIHPEDLPRFEKDMHEHLANRKPAINCTCRLELNNSFSWFLIRAMAIRDVFPGKPVKIAGSFENISENRRIDELKRQYDFQQKLMDTMPFPIFYKNAHGKYLGSNKAMFLYFDIDGGNIIGDSVENFSGWIPEETIRKIKKADELILNQGGKITLEINNIPNKIHGDRGDFLIHKVAFSDGNDDDVRIIGAIIDITELKRTQSALDAARIKLNIILDSMREIIIRYDNQMRVLWANQRASELFGIDPHLIIGTKCHKLWFNSEKPCEDCSEENGIRICKNEGINKMPDGKIFETVNYPVDGKTGAPRGKVQVAQDVTERELAREKARIQENQLIQADRLKALGVLVAGVAHEINNPNNYIMINSSLLKRISDDLLPFIENSLPSFQSMSFGGFPLPQLKSHLPEMLKGISEGSERIREIVLSLKEYSSHVMADMYSEFDLNFALKRALVLLDNPIKRATSRFSIIYGENLPLLKGDIYKIEQVILNIVQNSCDALPSQDKAVSIRTCRENNNAVLEVRDEGVGIPDENIKFIKDPFFTTKREQGGTGLGLSISNNIIQEHFGELFISSVLGEGTCVKIILPGL
ncbi:MAG: hypothetical protein A2020_05810 [Lentisphaerae bacterium GWF2_45_14]|nr:MAG: hypothetical protein A2020_05810 [Lentisphaerae bacterium GWF2_45_14]